MVADAKMQRNHQVKNDSEEKAVVDRDHWRMRPGYSSGGSSDLDPPEKTTTSGERNGGGSPSNSESKHSDILTSLKEDIALGHGLTTKVVRLEVGLSTHSQ